MELEALQESLKDFNNRGASLVALCPQRTEHNQAIVNELGLEFPVVQDQANLVSSAFGLTLTTPPDVIEAEKFFELDLPLHNGTDNWDLPMPARYVIDQNGIVRYASVNADHRMRSDPRECLELLNQ